MNEEGKRWLRFAREDLSVAELAMSAMIFNQEVLTTIEVLAEQGEEEDGETS